MIKKSILNNFKLAVLLNILIQLLPRASPLKHITAYTCLWSKVYNAKVWVVSLHTLFSVVSLLPWVSTLKHITCVNWLIIQVHIALSFYALNLLYELYNLTRPPPYIQAEIIFSVYNEIKFTSCMTYTCTTHRVGRVHFLIRCSFTSCTRVKSSLSLNWVDLTWFLLVWERILILFSLSVHSLIHVSKFILH